MMNTRLIAIKILEEVYEQNHFLKDVLDGYFYTHEFERHEKSFLKNLVYGTVEQQIKIDYIINQFSKVKTKKLKPFIYYVLSISVYQLLEMTSVPPSAVCNEAVKLVKKRKMYNLSGFVNGVLRTIDRELKYITYPDEKTQPQAYLNSFYALPMWLVDLLLSQYDYETVKAIAEDTMLAPDLSIRVNTLKTNPDKLMTTLKKQGLSVSKGHYLDNALRITSSTNLADNENFKNGDFIVQDESSMMVSYVLDAKDKDSILDMCAAPGGKSLHISESVASVEARDVSDRKVALINENIEKLGIKNIETKVFDGLIIDESIIDCFDGVIVDAPCSGLGIVRKKPDIKRNMSLERIENLIQIQEKLLNNASKYVKIGGSLIYSTCTINRAENIEQVEKFLKEHSDFKVEPIKLNEPLSNMFFNHGFLQMLPMNNLTDGFFIAKLKKVKND